MTYKTSDWVALGLLQLVALSHVGCGKERNIGGNQTGGGGTSSTIATGGSTGAQTGGSRNMTTAGGAFDSGLGGTNASTGGASSMATGGASSMATGGASSMATGGASSMATGGASSIVTGGSSSIATGGQMTADAGPADPRPKLLAQLAQAESLWSAQSASCTAYYYNRYVWSALGRMVWITTVQIQNGSPVWRRYFYSLGSWGTSKWPNPELTEGRDAMVPHPGEPYLFPASTVAELFAECRDILSADPANYDFGLVTNAQGLPTACTKTMHSCSDGCTSGIALASFACGVLDPCLGSDCPGTGPYQYACLSGCNTTVACQSLPDGTDCGNGVCAQGTCQ